MVCTCMLILAHAFNLECISNDNIFLIKGKLSDYFNNELQQQFFFWDKTKLNEELSRIFLHFRKLLKWYEIPKK